MCFPYLFLAHLMHLGIPIQLQGALPKGFEQLRLPHRDALGFTLGA